MKIKIAILSYSILFSFSVSAQIIHVPDDVPSIQAAIDSAQNCDTVLVHPGTYFENIVFNGKSITVASLFLISQDTSYISKTIIDGSNWAPVVCFQNGEDTSAMLLGFTIINGYSSIYFGPGGGISCSGASPTLKYLNITQNMAMEGAGIYCYNSAIKLIDITIHDNSAMYMMTGSGDGVGGGIYFSNSYPTLENVTIFNNNGGLGGGIYCAGSCPSFKNVIIRNNHAKIGGGIYFQDASPVFDVNMPCNIYNNIAIYGNDLYADTIVNIVVDTFTVLNPLEFHACPIQQFNFDISNGLYQQVSADIYISPDGNNENSGLSPDEPIKTIYHGFIILLTDSLHTHTIHLLDGTYSSSTNEEIFPLNLPDYVNLQGESENGVILDRERHGRIMLIENNKQNSLSDFTISGGEIHDWEYGGGGVLCINSDPILQHLTISNNRSIFPEVDWDQGFAGGIELFGSDATLKNVTIYGNNGPFGGGVSIRSNSNPVFQDVVITNNNSDYGGGMYIANTCNPEFKNVLLENNTAGTGGGICLNLDSTYSLANLTIRNNRAEKGGGLYSGGNIGFDNDNRCNIYFNQATNGNDIYSDYTLNVIVDTFSVITPLVYHACPLENFSFDILFGFAQTYENFFVSPQGKNTNSGITEDDPVKNIHCAFTRSLADSLHPQQINLLTGTYNTSSNNDLFPILIPDYITLKGISESQVTLDAEGDLQVISLRNKKEVYISDLTITGGYAKNGGGIEVDNSDGVIENLLIKGNYAYGGGIWQYGNGGGLYSNASNLLVKNTRFINNASSNGGGIYCKESNLTLEDINIKNNTAEQSGGGIYCRSSDPQLKRVRISGNIAEQSGGGMCVGEYGAGSNPYLQDVSITNNKSQKGGGITSMQYSNPIFDSLNRCNIYSNYAILGNDIYSDSWLHVIVDTFTVLNPSGFHAKPIENFTFDILNGFVSQTDADLYISPLGDNSNSGLSEGEALKTIRFASIKILSDSINPHTIHLANGTYSPSSTGDIFPICIPDYTHLNGTSATNTILDAEEQSGVFISKYNRGNEVSGLSMTGSSGRGISCVYSSPVLKNLIISGNDGGGISCGHSSPEIRNVIIEDNYSFRGGGIYCGNYSSPKLTNVSIKNNDGYYGGGGYFTNSNAVLTNVEIANNSAETFGGGLYIGGGDNTVLRNVTIADNEGTMYGGGIYCGNSNTSIINSIIWQNIPDQILIIDNNSSDTLTVSWSDIQGGEAGIVNENSNIIWGAGNIDEDPQFLNTGIYTFQLSSNSPCIDSGDPDTIGLLLPMYDLAGEPRIWNNRIDMGAYEWNNVGIAEIVFEPTELKVNTYPNPFSYTINIDYELPQDGTVIIKIYNYLGKLVETPVNYTQQKGKQQYILNVSGLPNGIYFIQVRAGQEMVTRKVMKMR